MNTNGAVTFYLRKSDGSIQIVTSLSSIPIDAWTHVVVAFDDDADLLTVFVNGLEDNTAPATAPYYGTGDAPAIGNNRWSGGDRPFNGVIDDVRFYDVALDAGDVAYLYDLCQPPLPSICREPAALSNTCAQGEDSPAQLFEVWNCGSGTLSYAIADDAGWLLCDPTSESSTGEHDTITVNYTTAGLAPGTYSATITISDPAAPNDPQLLAIELIVLPSPVAHWCFDDCTPTDCSGHGLNGTNYGAVCVTGPGTCGSAFEFTGSDEISVPATFDDSATAGLTVTAWLYWSGSSLESYVFDARHSNTAGFILYLNPSGTVTFYLRKPDTDVQTVTSVSPVPIGAWTYVTATFDDAADLLTLFINAVPDNTAGATAPYYPTGWSPTIGNNIFGGSDRPFNGIIDEVRFYDEAMSSDEVECLMELCAD